MSPVDLVILILSRLNPAPFVLGWMETRPWRLLIAGLPVLLAIAGTAWLRSATNSASADVTVRHYLVTAGDALRRGDDEAAELRFRRVLLASPKDQRARLGLATIAEKRGNLAMATAMMESLANEEGDVAHQANRWLIAKALNEKPDAASRQRLVDRLERAVRLEPENVSYREKLADIYAQAKLYEHAIKHLRVVAPLRPVHRISLLRLYRAAGDEDAIRAEAPLTERYFRDRISNAPGDIDSRFLCAWALIFQKRHPEAITVVEEGAALGDPQVVRKMTALIRTAWARDLHAERRDPKTVLALTSAALKAEPSNPAALLLLADLARDAIAGQEAVGLLEEQLAAGESPWLIHMVLGTRALELGNSRQGAEHLEQAVKLNPAAAIAMNNLAWTLATQEPTDLDRAESLAAQAVMLSPANPQIRETRGQIYLKQGRWKEALTDLEAVLPVYAREGQLASQLPQIHNALAKAYENLGNAAMAKRHRELALSRQPAMP